MVRTSPRWLECLSLTHLTYMYFDSTSNTPQDWPAGWLLFTSIYSLSGGFTTSMLALYSILAATTPTHLRTTRIGLLHVTTTGGWMAGNLLAPLVFHKWNYYGTFSSSLLVTCLSLVITCVVLTDPPLEPSTSSQTSQGPSRPPSPPPGSTSSPASKLLQAWRCMVAPRPARPSLLLLLAGSFENII